MLTNFVNYLTLASGSIFHSQHITKKKNQTQSLFNLIAKSIFKI